MMSIDGNDGKSDNWPTSGSIRKNNKAAYRNSPKNAVADQSEPKDIQRRIVLIIWRPALVSFSSRPCLLALLGSDLDHPNRADDDIGWPKVVETSRQWFGKMDDEGCKWKWWMILKLARRTQFTGTFFCASLALLIVNETSHWACVNLWWSSTHC